MHSLRLDCSLKFLDITSANLSIRVPFAGTLLPHVGRDLLESKFYSKFKNFYI